MMILCLIGIIDTFLSWKAFLPLSRLTYMAYLLHIEVLSIFFGTMTAPIHFNNFLLVRTLQEQRNKSCCITVITNILDLQSQWYIGIMCFVFGASFVASLAVESPFIGLEKILLKGTSCIFETFNLS